MNPKSFPIVSWLSLTLALPAAADVIYSNLQDIAIPADFAGVYLDVDTGNWNTDINAPQSGWDINPFFGGSVVWTSPTFQPVRSGTGNMSAVVNLAEGASVSGGSTYSTFTWDHDNNIITPQVPGYGGSETHLGGGAGQFTAGQEGYIGFRLNDTNYGYMRVLFTNNTGGALIKEWAYDDDGVSIAVANVKRSGSTVALDSSQGSFTLSSPVVNSYGTTNLLKTGSGTTTLTGTNTYTGTTTVNAGTLTIASLGSTHASSAVTVSNSGSALIVNGTVGGSLLMNANTTLSGTGTITGNATISGTHNPGNSPGIQTFSGNLAYVDGGTPDPVINWELNGNTTTNAANPNAVFDQIIVGGNLDFTNLTTVNLILNGVGSNVLWANSLWDTSQSWTLFDVAGTTTNFSNLSLTTINWLDSGSNAFNTARPGNSFSLSLSGQDVLINYTVVPETSTALLGALGTLALLRRRRA